MNKEAQVNIYDKADHSHSNILLHLCRSSST